MSITAPAPTAQTAPPLVPAQPKVSSETQQAINQTAGYLVLKEVAMRDINGESHVHHIGTVLSAWEAEPFVKMKLAEGSYRYRALLEPLTADEVANHREKATAVEGDRVVDGQSISPPWGDYVGLHPEEIIERLRRTTDRGLIERVRLYERGGLKRAPILEYTPPAERQPWLGYDDMNYSDVLKKLDLVGPEAVQEVMSYETAHRRRPAILTYEPPAPTPRPSFSQIASEAANGDDGFDNGENEGGD